MLYGADLFLNILHLRSLVSHSDSVSLVELLVASTTHISHRDLVLIPLVLKDYVRLKWKNFDGSSVGTNMQLPRMLQSLTKYLQL